MVTSMSPEEKKQMLESIDECKLQGKIWKAIQALQTIDLGINPKNPRFTEGERVFVGNNEYSVNDYCEINGHFVYQLAIPEDRVYYIIAIEEIIRKKE